MSLSICLRPSFVVQRSSKLWWQPLDYGNNWRAAPVSNKGDVRFVTPRAEYVHGILILLKVEYWNCSRQCCESDSLSPGLPLHTKCCRSARSWLQRDWCFVQPNQAGNVLRDQHIWVRPESESGKDQNTRGPIRIAACRCWVERGVGHGMSPKVWIRWISLLFELYHAQSHVQLLDLPLAHCRSLFIEDVRVCLVSNISSRSSLPHAPSRQR